MHWPRAPSALQPRLQLPAPQLWADPQPGKHTGHSNTFIVCVGLLLLSFTVCRVRRSSMTTTWKNCVVSWQEPFYKLTRWQARLHTCLYSLAFDSEWYPAPGEKWEKNKYWKRAVLTSLVYLKPCTYSSCLLYSIIFVSFWFDGKLQNISLFEYNDNKIF